MKSMTIPVGLDRPSTAQIRTTLWCMSVQFQYDPRETVVSSTPRTSDKTSRHSADINISFPITTPVIQRSLVTERMSQINYTK